MKKLLFIFVALLFISCNNDDNYYVDYSKSVKLTDVYLTKNYGSTAANIYGTFKNTANKNIRVVVNYKIVNRLDVVLGEYKSPEIDVYPFETKINHHIDTRYFYEENVKVKDARVQVVTTF